MIYGIKIGSIDLYSLLVDCAILLYTLVDWNSLISNDHLLVLIFLIFINVIWQIYSTIKECRDFYKRVNCFSTPIGVSKDYKFDDELSKHYDVLLLEEINQVVLISSSSNMIIRKSSIKCRRVHSKEKRTDKYIKTYKSILLKFLNFKWHSMSDKGGAFYNEKKLCMASELYENRLSDGTYIVALCQGCYYNSFLTNNAYSICLNESGFIIDAPRNVNNYKIKSFSDSEFGDHIGVSTIVISTDGFAFLMRHNNKTAMFTNELLPTASGSVDFTDYNKNLDLQSIIINAVERELKEETNIKNEVIDKTVVTGFYRCLSRGGKPEFCCITYLNIDKLDVLEVIRPNVREQSEELHAIRISTDNNNFGSISNFIKSNISECSLPLYMSYYMMLDYHNIVPDIGHKCSIKDYEFRDCHRDLAL